MDWILNIVFSALSAISFLVGAYIIFRVVRKYNESGLFYLMLSSLFYGASQITVLIAHLSVSVTIYQLKVFSLALVVISLNFAVSYMRSDRVMLRALWPFIILSSLMIYAIYFELPSVRRISMDGGVMFGDQGLTFWMLTLDFLLVAILFIYHIMKIDRMAPRYLKQPITYVLVGFSMVTLGGLFIYVFDIPLYIRHILTIIGSLMYTISFAKYPEIFNILPFQAKKLMVMDRNTGKSLYQHDWTNEGYPKDELLFSNVLKAISDFVTETLQLGEIKTLYLNNGVLMIRDNYKSSPKVYFLLITNRYSPSLNRNLDVFMHAFLHEFHNIEHHHDYQTFTGMLDGLVLECFPNVPAYDLDILTPSED